MTLAHSSGWWNLLTICKQNNSSEMKKTIMHWISIIISIEPEVSTEPEVDQDKPERIININSSMTSRGRTFDIDLPIISMKNGPFR